MLQLQGLLGAAHILGLPAHLLDQRGHHLFRRRIISAEEHHRLYAVVSIGVFFEILEAIDFERLHYLLSLAEKLGASLCRIARCSSHALGPPTGLVQPTRTFLFKLSLISVRPSSLPGTVWPGRRPLHRPRPSEGRPPYALT